MSITAEFTKLTELVKDMEGDVAKAQSGNSAAGTRVRKGMQMVKKQAQEVKLASAALTQEAKAARAAGKTVKA